MGWREVQRECGRVRGGWGVWRAVDRWEGTRPARRKLEMCGDNVGCVK